MKLSNHWVADIFPLNDSDVERLAEDIDANGQLTPIIVLNGAIIDGRTRFAACKKLGIEPIIEQYQPQNGEVTDDELLALSWSLNEARRHLSTSQRACAAAEVMERIGVQRGGDRKSKEAKSNPRNRVWSAFAVKEDTVRYARQLLTEAPVLFKQVKAGELTVGAAYEAFKKTKAFEKEEVAKSSLAEIQDKDPDLAEQVETGKITIDEAKTAIMKAEEVKRKRASDVSTAATGVYVAVAGILSALDFLAGMESSPEESIENRKPMQLRDDSKRLTKAIEVLQAYLNATNKKLN